MAYNLEPITEELVTAVLAARPGLKQPEILDQLRGPIEYYAEDGTIEVDGVVEKITAGDVIKRPHTDLEDVLRHMKLTGKAHFWPKGAAGGWRLR